MPPWEEVNQRDLFRAQKLFYDKPVYLELFRLDPIEFRDRGVFTEDTRDRERLAYIKKFQETGSVPDHFIEVSSLDDPLLSAHPLSDRELDLATYFDRHFRSSPRLSHASGTVVEMDTLDQADVAILIVSCQKNVTRQDRIRATWAKDLEALGIPYFFVVGRPGCESQIIGDTLYLDVMDSYEFLASKY